jgi:hypothetical protein
LGCIILIYHWKFTCEEATFFSKSRLIKWAPRSHSLYNSGQNDENQWNNVTNNQLIFVTFIISWSSFVPINGKYKESYKCPDHVISRFIAITLSETQYEWRKIEPVTISSTSALAATRCCLYWLWNSFLTINSDSTHQKSMKFAFIVTGSIFLQS